MEVVFKQDTLSMPFNYVWTFDSSKHFIKDAHGETLIAPYVEQAFLEWGVLVEVQSEESRGAGPNDPMAKVTTITADTGIKQSWWVTDGDKVIVLAPRLIRVHWAWRD